MESQKVIKLPPGFRFHPTDEELVVQYLRRKALSYPLPAWIIPDVHLNQYNPWDLPLNSGVGCGEKKERYLFNYYRGGDVRSNKKLLRRVAGSGYWKSTGSEKMIVVGPGNEVVEKVYLTSVTDNFLEIHFFWAGKGTCCIPFDGSYGSLISAISVAPNFVPTVSNQPPNTDSTNMTGLVVGIVIGVSALLIILVSGLWIWRQRKIRNAYQHNFPELNELTIASDNFSYMELKNATGDFSPKNKLGEGGFGAVYMGRLSNNDRIVAVKELTAGSSQGKQQFVAEVSIISKVKHRNLVNLYGCCYEGNKRLLVYEYMENKSLDRALFGNTGLYLDWPTRYKICLGTAKGLTYLHEESRYRIIHRDIKSSNILLDADLNPKISDFGLAKLYDDKMTHIITKVAGTTGYLAPEYAMRGHLTEKVDVYAFGIVILEILSGRSIFRPKLDDDKYLIEWVWELHEANRDIEVIDSTLSAFNKEEAERAMGVAFLCTQMNHLLRPKMSRVVSMLLGEVELKEVPSKPSYIAEWNYDDLSEIGETSSSFPFGNTQSSTFR